MSINRTGVPYSTEAILSYRRAATKRQGKPILCLETNVVYESCRSAIREIWGIDTNALSNAMKKSNGWYRGFTFIFI